MKREDGRAKEFDDAAIDVFLEEGVSRYHIKMRSVSTSVEVADEVLGDDNWRRAMDDEYSMLMRNKT
jgi:hypothetical protein